MAVPGKRPDEILGVDLGDRMSVLTRAVIAMSHLEQTRAWTDHIIHGLETTLAAAQLAGQLGRVVQRASIKHVVFGVLLLPQGTGRL